MRRIVFTMLCLTGLAASSGRALAAQQDDDRWLRHCDDGYRSDRSEQFCEVRHLGFRPSGGTLTFDPDQNGGVEIRGWDRDSVAITARVQTSAQSEDAAKDLARDIKVTIEGSQIRVDGPRSSGRAGWGVTLVAMVPRKTDLRAETTNGPLSVDGVTGTMELRAQNGPISLTAVGGDVNARVENGPLTVELGGRERAGKGLDAESVNGPVELAIPDGYNAELETGTVNGPTDFEIPISVTLHGRRQDRIRTTLGKGGVPLRVVTTNGPLTIRKASI